MAQSHVYLDGQPQTADVVRPATFGDYVLRRTSFTRDGAIHEWPGFFQIGLARIRDLSTTPIETATGCSSAPRLNSQNKV